MKITQPTQSQSEEQILVDYVNDYLDGKIEVTSLLPKWYIKRSNPYEWEPIVKQKKNISKKLELA